MREAEAKSIQILNPLKERIRTLNRSDNVDQKQKVKEEKGRLLKYSDLLSRSKLLMDMCY